MKGETVLWSLSIRAKGIARIVGTTMVLTSRHTLKLWERIIGQRLRGRVTVSEQQFGQQFGFMPARSTSDAIFALRQLMETYREGQETCTASSWIWRRHVIGYPDRKYGIASG